MGQPRFKTREKAGGARTRQWQRVSDRISDKVLTHRKTAGRGHKGTYARSGGTIPRGFEGGQTPLHKRLPKIGMRVNRFNTMKLNEKINLGQIAYYIEKGRLDPRK